MKLDYFFSFETVIQCVGDSKVYILVLHLPAMQKVLRCYSSNIHDLHDIVSKITLLDEKELEEYLTGCFKSGYLIKPCVD